MNLLNFNCVKKREPIIDWFHLETNCLDDKIIAQPNRNVKHIFTRAEFVTKNVRSGQQTCKIDKNNLGNTTVNVSTIRTWKYKILNIVKKLISGAGMKHRILNCMHLIHSGSADIKRNSKTGKAYYSGISVCGSVWLCPVCSSRIAQGRREELGLASKSGMMPVMVSVTLQHYRNDELKKLLSVLNGSLRELKQGNWWKSFIKRYGIKAHVSSLEITFSERHGWHPHKHILLFLDVSDGEKDLKALKSELIQRYTNLVSEKGGYASDFHSIDVTACSDNINGYIAKWGLINEVANAHIKVGRAKDSYSPFQLAEIAGAGERWALVAYLEYVEATYGKKQITWSHNARKVLGIGKEKTDQELAKEHESLDDEIILSIEREQWKRVLRNGVQGELLELAEKGGDGAVISYLAGLDPGTTNYNY